MRKALVHQEPYSYRGNYENIFERTLQLSSLQLKQISILEL
jgi:hypothetical protein